MFSSVSTIFIVSAFMLIHMFLDKQHLPCQFLLYCGLLHTWACQVLDSYYFFHFPIKVYRLENCCWYLSLPKLGQPCMPNLDEEKQRRKHVKINISSWVPSCSRKQHQLIGLVWIKASHVGKWGGRSWPYSRSSNFLVLKLFEEDYKGQKFVLGLLFLWFNCEASVQPLGHWWDWRIFGLDSYYNCIPCSVDVSILEAVPWEEGYPHCPYILWMVLQCVFHVLWICSWSWYLG